MTDPTVIDLLSDVDAYLCALHVHGDRHDQIGADLTCGGCVLRDRIAAALPQLAAVPPADQTTDRADLCDPIADALAAKFTSGAEHTQGMRVAFEGPDGWPATRMVTPIEAADAVLAVLPEPADRAAILTEAADAVAADNHGILYGTASDYANRHADLLRRMAAEAQPTTKPETESCARCGKTIRRISGTLTEWWVHVPGGQAFCYPWQPASSPRATPQPAAGVGQDGAQSP